VTPGSNQGSHPPRPLPQTKQVDPCTIATAPVLQALLSQGIKSYFPRTMQSGGKHIKLSDPEIEQVTCPNMTVRAKFKVEYRETRGFPQFQVSGYCGDAVTAGCPSAVSTQWQ
jgi:hypothetical protein